MVTNDRVSVACATIRGRGVRCIRGDRGHIRQGRLRSNSASSSSQNAASGRPSLTSSCPVWGGRGRSAPARLGFRPEFDAGHLVRVRLTGDVVGKVRQTAAVGWGEQTGEPRRTTSASGTPILIPQGARWPCAAHNESVRHSPATRSTTLREKFVGTCDGPARWRSGRGVFLAAADLTAEVLKDPI